MNASAPSFVPSTTAKNEDQSNNNNDSLKTTRKSNNKHKSNSNECKDNKPINNQKRPNNNKKKYNNNRNYQRVTNDLNDLSLVEVAQKTGGSTDKKGRVSLNHLLSFSFPERQQQTPAPYRKHKVVSYEPFNKERFINANFRFVLNPTGNYIYQLADPDINFDWESIEQVLISSSETQACPICLSPPTAARVTKCGHIYCLPCILHYLALRENPKRLWRKCPICYESIYETDLKPVRMMRPFAVSDHAVDVNNNTLSCGVTEGDRVDLTLLQRASNSTLAFPLSDTWPLPSNVVSNYMKPDMPLIPWHFTPGAMTFARFMLGTPEYLEAEYSRDCVELDDYMSDVAGWGSAQEIPYIESSVEKIQAKIKQLNQQKTKELALTIQTSEMMFEAVAKYNKKHGKKKAGEEAVSSASTSQQVPEAYYAQQQEMPALRPSNNNNKPTNDFYFYQAVDGQHVYLHPLDIRILKHEYGEYDQFPPQLQVQAMSVQESTLTEELRKKCKYLGHLPLACDVTFLEINVKDIVSEATIQVYKNELDARVKRRKEKERREEQKQKMAENKQKMQMVKEQEQERHMLETDPFFTMYRPPMTEEESEEQLSLALSESAASSSSERVIPGAYVPGTSRTVWGTKQVAPREEEPIHDWADHIVITKSHRKKRGKK